MLDWLGVKPLEFFPAFNASLNAACTLILICGWVAIKQRRITLHKTLMLTAFGVSTAFLASYLYYHFAVRDPQLSKYPPEKPFRSLYLAVLLSHTILATLVAVFVPITLYLGFGAPGNRHVWLARKVLPVWLYVSITGVVVYWMLYRM
jgi:putative membrane protein